MAEEAVTRPPRPPRAVGAPARADNGVVVVVAVDCEGGGGRKKLVKEKAFFFGTAPGVVAKRVAENWEASVAPSPPPRADRGEFIQQKCVCLSVCLCFTQCGYNRGKIKFKEEEKVGRILKKVNEFRNR